MLENLQENLQKISERLEKTIIYEFDDIQNNEAKKIIMHYLKQIKKERHTITVFEISQKLRLPADQVEDILEELSKEEKIHFKDG